VKAQVRLKRAGTEKDPPEVDRDTTRDDNGRLRRLWRRATGNGPNAAPGNPSALDEEDEDDGGDPTEQ